MKIKVVHSDPVATRRANVAVVTVKVNIESVCDETAGEN